MPWGIKETSQRRKEIAMGNKRDQSKEKRKCHGGIKETSQRRKENATGNKGDQSKEKKKCHGE